MCLESKSLNILLESSEVIVVMQFDYDVLHPIQEVAICQNLFFGTFNVELQEVNAVYALFFGIARQWSMRKP